ncbi:MAG: PEP-CTERM sorting domain-containing protein [Burkholderiales bacterium]
MTASLQAVRSGALPGYGWALLPFMPNGTNGVDFVSSELLPVDLRPLLTVEVAPVPEPETYALLLLAGLTLVGAAHRRSKRKNRGVALY